MLGLNQIEYVDIISNWVVDLYVNDSTIVLLIDFLQSIPISKCEMNYDLIYVKMHKQIMDGADLNLTIKLFECILNHARSLNFENQHVEEIVDFYINGFCYGEFPRIILLIVLSAHYDLKCERFALIWKTCD